MIKKVIKEIYNQLQDGNEVYKYSIIHHQLLSAIYFFLKHNNSAIRILSSMCFKQFCKVLNSKQNLAESNMIKGCMFLFDDVEIQVRKNAYSGLLFFAQSRYGIDTLLENEILEKIIAKIKEEAEPEVLDLILTLHNEIICAQNGPQISLKNGIIDVIFKFLKSKNLNVTMTMIT